MKVVLLSLLGLAYLLVSDIFRGWFHQTISIG